MMAEWVESSAVDPLAGVVYKRDVEVWIEPPCSLD
jgi:hypothetical protein